NFRNSSIVRLTIASCVVIFVLTGILLLLRIPREHLIAYDVVRTNPARVRLIRELRNTGGRYLIFVHYRPEHDVHDEWVYNDADIDGSKIVWAREMDSASNEKLIEYFKDRQLFTLDADEEQPLLRKVSPAKHDTFTTGTMTER